MTVAELIQELLNSDPSLEVTIFDEDSGLYEPVHSWDPIYPMDDGPVRSIVLWPRD